MGGGNSGRATAPSSAGALPPLRIPTPATRGRAVPWPKAEAARMPPPSPLHFTGHQSPAQTLRSRSLDATPADT